MDEDEAELESEEDEEDEDEDEVQLTRFNSSYMFHSNIATGYLTPHLSTGRV